MLDYRIWKSLFLPFPTPLIQGKNYASILYTTYVSSLHVRIHIWVNLIIPSPPSGWSEAWIRLCSSVNWCWCHDHQHFSQTDTNQDESTCCPRLECSANNSAKFFPLLLLPNWYYAIILAFGDALRIEITRSRWNILKITTALLFYPLKWRVVKSNFCSWFICFSCNGCKKCCLNELAAMQVVICIEDMYRRFQVLNNKQL